MPSTTVILSVGILIISFVIGIIFFYMTSTETKEMKKKQLEDVISLTINFVIYIWVGKIIVNFPKFISDPLAILAFPSNSKAFYVATLFIIINLFYRKLRHKQDVGIILQVFLPVFLAASFMYEFLQIVAVGKQINGIYLGFMMTLLIAYIGLLGKISLHRLSLVLGGIWLGCQLVLSLLLYATIFGYRLTSIYFLSLIMLSLIVYVYRNKRKV